MRLTDADALAKMLDRQEKDCNPDHFDGHETFIDKIDAHDGYGEWMFANGFNLGIDVSIGEVMRSPTVDAVPVVWCKDCKHNYYNMIPSGEAEHECTKFIELPITADFYCAWGEREDEVTE